MKAFRRKQRLDREKKFRQLQLENGDHQDPQRLDPVEKSSSEAASEDLEQSGSLVLRQRHQEKETMGPPIDHSSPLAIIQRQDWHDYPVHSKFCWPREITSLGLFGLSPPVTCSTWHHLFTHFMYEIAPIIQPLGINSHLNPVNTVWAQRAMTDPALFQGILFHASVHLDLRQHRPLSSTTLFHRGETIRLVSERLKDSDRLVSDETIAAVGWVASEGNITGDVAGGQVHWGALQEMVRMRGGLHSLGWNGALELLISTANIISSMVACSPPIIERPTLTGSEFPDIPSSLMHATGDVLTLLEFSEQIMNLLRFMNKLAIAYSALISTAGATVKEIVAFNKLRAAAEHKLLSIRVLPPPHPSPRNQLEAAVYEACRLTALMCSNCIFRDFLPSGAAFRILNERVILTLTEIEGFSDLDDVRDFEELLLWVYFIGGMISVEKEWFALRVAKSMSALRFQSWSVVENCLMRYIWAEKMRNRYCIALWQEVKKVGLFSEGAT